MNDSSSSATASLVLGIVALACVFILNMPWWVGFACGILATYFGSQGLKAIPSGRPGRGQAVAGMVCGILSVACTGVAALCVCTGLAVGSFGLLAVL